MVHNGVTEDVANDIPKVSAGHERGRGQVLHGNPPPHPPPHALVSTEQLLATQNELMGMLVQNEA
jgi:hypothetical protein